MSVQATPGFDLQPSAQRVPLATNYITDFEFLNQYLPDSLIKLFGQSKEDYILNIQRLVLLLLQVLMLQLSQLTIQVFLLSLLGELLLGIDLLLELDRLL